MRDFPTWGIWVSEFRASGLGLGGSGFNWSFSLDAGIQGCLMVAWMSVTYGAMPITTYSLHCSSFFWFNQIYNKDPLSYPQKGTTMETTGIDATAKATVLGTGKGRNILSVRACIENNRHKAS